MGHYFRRFAFCHVVFRADGVHVWFGGHAGRDRDDIFLYRGLVNGVVEDGGGIRIVIISAS